MAKKKSKTAETKPATKKKAFTGEEGLEARNATMEPAGSPKARNQLSTASKDG